MIPLNVTDGIEYGILERAELPAMARLLAEVFSRYEPLSGAVGLSAPEFEVLVGAFGPKALTEQLSIVARPVHTDGLVGALADIVPSFAPHSAKPRATRRSTCCASSASVKSWLHRTRTSCSTVSVSSRRSSARWRPSSGREILENRRLRSPADRENDSGRRAEPGSPGLRRGG